MSKFGSLHTEEIHQLKNIGIDITRTPCKNCGKDLTKGDIRIGKNFCNKCLEFEKKEDENDSGNEFDSFYGK